MDWTDFKKRTPLPKPDIRVAGMADKLKIFLVAGARPNFMKVAPIYRESLKHARLVCKLVHTGQHYDYEMSQAFFEDLEIPKPDFFLNAGSGSHAVQTARIMVAFEELCEQSEKMLRLSRMGWQGFFYFPLF